jgi:phosphoglycolate phosphatase
VDALAARALVFDLDGTVWDSYPWLARIIGGADEPACAAALASLREQQPAARLLRDAGVTPDRFSAACRDADDLAVYPAVPEALSSLQRKGIGLAVVTNLPGWVAEPMLEHLDLRDFVDPVVPYSRAGKAERISLALGELGVRAEEEAWYVGDTVADARAARGAGVAFAWAAYGYGLEAVEDADAVLTEFADVLAL